MGFESPIDRVHSMKKPVVEKAQELNGAIGEADAYSPEELAKLEHERWGKNLSKALRDIGQAEAVLQLAEKIHEKLPDSALSGYLQSQLEGIVGTVVALEDADTTLRTHGIGGEGKLGWYSKAREFAYGVNSARKAEEAMVGLSHRVRDTLRFIAEIDHKITLAQAANDTTRLEFLQNVKGDVDALGGWNGIVDLIPPELIALRKREVKE